MRLEFVPIRTTVSSPRERWLSAAGSGQVAKKDFIQKVPLGLARAL